FGLSTVPGLLTRVSKPILSWRSITRHPGIVYLHYWIVVVKSKYRSLQLTNKLIAMMKSLGWLINRYMSTLTHNQSLQHFGF
ncbi:hypothetical protein BGW37DRAFT_423911, partial [Umbelopsis sp. PMI_123]